MKLGEKKLYLDAFIKFYFEAEIAALCVASEMAIAIMSSKRRAALRQHTSRLAPPQSRQYRICTTHSRFPYNKASHHLRKLRAWNHFHAQNPDQPRPRYPYRYIRFSHLRQDQEPIRIVPALRHLNSDSDSSNPRIPERGMNRTRNKKR